VPDKPNARQMPALFVSHGSPTLVLDDVPAREFLAGAAATLPRPNAIIVVSAHYESTGRVAVCDDPAPRTIHDFRGFPDALYRMQYPAPGAPELAARIVAAIAQAGIPAVSDRSWGLDHGAWVPLSLMYPKADIPVVAVSVDPGQGPAHHHALGRALAAFRDEGVLILGSGALTHNLAEIPRPFKALNVDASSWVADFADWMAAALRESRVEDLLAYRARAPHAARNHPTEEHLMPLYAALGAGGGDSGGAGGVTVRRLHASTTFGVLAMDAYAFGSTEQTG